MLRSSFAKMLFGSGRTSVRYLRVGVLGLAMATGTMVGCGGSDEAEVTETPKQEPQRFPSGGPGTTPPASGNQNAGGGSSGQTASRGPTIPGGGSGTASRGPTIPGGGGGTASRGPTIPGGGSGNASRGPTIPGGGGAPAGGQRRGGAAPVQGPPPRPEDFAKWTVKHFKDSVRERDVKAEEAVKWLGENKPDDATAGLLVEMLALLNEPAKEPPAGIRGGSPAGGRRGPGAPGGGRRGPTAPGGGGRSPSVPGGPPAGGGGAGGAVAGLNDAVLKETILAALSGRMSSTLLASMVVQQQGYPGGQNGPPEGYPGGQNGPPEGYPGGQNGPPEGYPGGQNGPPGRLSQAESDGMQEGYPRWPEGYPGGGGMQEGPPEGYPGAGGMQEGYPGAGQGSSSGPPGAGGGLAGGRRSGGNASGANSGAYAHFGTMNVDEFIKTTIGVLLKLDTPRAWDAVDKMLTGAFELPSGGTDVSSVLMAQLISGYGGENHPSHTLITDSMNGANRDALLSTLTGYAMTSADRLLGLNANTAVAGANQGRGRGRGLNGGGGSRGPAFGGGGSRGPAFGGGGSRGPAAPGGGGQNSPPPPAGAPITMNATPKQMEEGEMKKITSLLFNEDFGGQVVDGLSSAGSPADVPQLLALASSLPTTAVRRAQYQMLSNARKQGPQSLIDAGFFTKVAHDPGLLVTLKSLPRERGESLVQKQWDDAHVDAVMAFRDRLKTAARGAGALEVRKPTPMTLHKGYAGHVAASLHKKWPRDVGGMIGSMEPGATEVRYIRLEVPDPDKNGKKIIDHYKKGSKTSEEYDNTRRHYWFSRVRDIRNSPLRRSVDILITQGRSGGGGAPAGGAGAGFAGGGGGGGNSVIIVEIISVDTANPRDTVVAATP